MSNYTWQSTLYFVCVEIRDKYSNPGTRCASVIMIWSHGISRLHVCFEFIVFPFGKSILIGNLAGRLLTTGAPSIRKCPVAPESEKYHCTARFRFGVLTLVADFGSSCILLDCTIDCHDVCRVGMGIGAELKNSAILVISGAHSPEYFVLSSFVVIVPSYEI